MTKANRSKKPVREPSTSPGGRRAVSGLRPQLKDGVLRVGLLGLGTVGTGVAEILTRHADLIAQRTGLQVRLVRAFVRRLRRRRDGAASDVPVTARAADVVAAADVDIVVELLGGIEPARQLILEALANGKSVVTANKAVLALHGPELLRTASTCDSDVYFEAAVAGGIPIIRTLREGLASDRISRVRGILNGTTNFVLSLMDRGASYAEALSEAQRLGYAEADPTLDVNGRDAADKLAILVQLAFGTAVRPDGLPTEGITNLSEAVLADARELGYQVKLLALAKRVQTPKGERLDARVHPAFVPVGHALSTVPDNQNAISVVSDALGATLYQGPGAGGMPTGSAVVSDLIEAARNMRAGVRGRVVVERAKSAPRLLNADEAVSAYYLRLLVDDRPGVLAAITRVLAANKISLAAVFQRDHGRSDGGPVPLVLVSHPTRRGAMDKALAAIAKQDALHDRISVVRIEADSGPYAAA